jgi:holo-[acyl-carrier protein] synthase
LIISTGIDLIEIAQFQAAVERHGKRFLERIFTENELAECGDHLLSLAARFAAKEAVAKALGTGIGPVGWRVIEIRRGEARRPVLRLCGAAERLAVELGLSQWSISLTHTEHAAAAVVMAAGE